MSTQRTPPLNKGALSAGAGVSEGESTSNLSNYEEERQTLRQQRKRKDRGTEYDFKKDLSDLRLYMADLIKETFQAQNANITAIHNDIQEIKDEIKTIKSTTETLTAEYKKLNVAVENITVQHKSTLAKIADIEKDLTSLKSNQIDQGSMSHASDELINELQDRLHREKNIVVVGLKESGHGDVLKQNQEDSEKLMNILHGINECCPKPLKTIRLGKYSEDKPRSIKVFFESSDTAKFLLRNKHKLPTNYRIFSDKTPKQQIYLKDLATELKRRQDAGETDLIIKYIKGVPTITKKTSNI